MSRLQIVRTSLFAIVVMLGIMGISADAQTDAAGAQLSARQMASVKAAAARPKPTTFWSVTQDFEGNFDKIDEYMATFRREAIAQNIANANPVGIVVLYEDPTGKSQFRLGVGLMLTRQVRVKAPLKAERVSFSRAVAYTHTGPYEQLENVYRTVEVAVRESPQRATKGAAAEPAAAGWPVVLKLLSDPKKARREQQRTQLIVPVK